MRCGTSPGVAITPATIRTESWLALAAGAHGLGFFPPDWNNGAVSVISGISTRIRQLEPALLQPAQPVSVEGGPDVRAAARSYHDAVYVIAVNAGTTANSPTTIGRFSLPNPLSAPSPSGSKPAMSSPSPSMGIVYHNVLYDTQNLGRKWGLRACF